MRYVVLQRASEDTWEHIGPAAVEFSLDEARAYATVCSQAAEVAIAQIQTIYSSERTVTARPVVEPKTLKRVS